MSAVEAMPSQWAVNAVNAMLSPQLKQQFRKTKLCVNYQKNRCDVGDFASIFIVFHGFSLVFIDVNRFP